MTKLTITRTGAESYAVVTDTVLTDGSFRADSHMCITGNVLRSFEKRGFFRVGGLMRVSLGPIALAKIQALAITDSVTLESR